MRDREREKEEEKYDRSSDKSREDKNTNCAKSTSCRICDTSKLIFLYNRIAKNSSMRTNSNAIFN